MPLPPALAAKLAKRGLLAGKSKPANPPGFVEEVIAESYDDPKSTQQPPSAPKNKLAVDKERNKENTSKLIHSGHPGCPNKCNVYHICTSFCVKKWGVGKAQPDAKYDLRRRKMLKKYPLPSGWLEVFDPGMGRYYYWNTSSDDVCWHSPKHPKAKIGKAAVELRAKVATEGEKPSSGNFPMLPANKPEFMDVDKERDMDRDRDRDRERNNRPYHDNRFKKPDHRDRRRRNRDDDELDPMDPSAYSDVPRGSWNSGLLPEGAKTGVDTTASGSLFQQRPLPSPGDVMRANADKSGKK